MDVNICLFQLTRTTYLRPKLPMFHGLWSFLMAIKILGILCDNQLAGRLLLLNVLGSDIILYVGWHAAATALLPTAQRSHWLSSYVKRHNDGALAMP